VLGYMMTRGGGRKIRYVTLREGTGLKGKKGTGPAMTVQENHLTICHTVGSGGKTVLIPRGKKRRGEKASE